MRCALLLLLAGCSTATADSFFEVHDGDTFTQNGQRWRIWGVDAPELQQTCDASGVTIRCGVLARDFLIGITSGHDIICEWRGTSYDRNVGRCSVGDVDIGREMVWRGWAVDWPRYSHGQYAAEQADAKANTRGIWGMQFTLPWEWRKTHAH